MLKYGSRGSEAVDLKRELNRLGFGLNNAPRIGLAAMFAIKKFQNENNLIADGEVDGITVKEIRSKLYAQNKAPVIAPELDNVISFPQPAEEVEAEPFKDYPRGKHFTYWDFINPDDIYTVENGIPEEYWGNIQEVIDRLDKVQDFYPENKLIIRSGFRSEEYNKAIRGASDSQHLYGKAMDIYFVNRIINTYTLARELMRGELKGLFTGYGLGSNTNLHVDIRENKAFWWYKFKSWDQWKHYQNR